jgi:hypothetical protein
MCREIFRHFAALSDLNLGAKNSSLKIICILKSVCVTGLIAAV